MKSNKTKKFKNSFFKKVKKGVSKAKKNVCLFFKKIGNFFKKTGISIGLFFKKCGVSIAGFFKKTAVDTGNFFKTKYSMCIAFFKKNYQRAVHFMSGESDFVMYVKNHKKWFLGGTLVLYTLVIITVTAVVISAIYKPKAFVIDTSSDNNGLNYYDTEFVLKEGRSYALSDNCTVWYEGTDFETVIAPENVNKTGEYFAQSYMNENEDNVYMDVKIRYTNKSDEIIAGDKAVKMTANIDGILRNCTFTTVENTDGTDMNFSSAVKIKAGETVLIHCIFDVPKNTERAKEITAEGFSDDKSYIINIREQIKQNG